jgi:hypothetical protein
LRVYGAAPASRATPPHPFALAAPPPTQHDAAATLAGGRSALPAADLCGKARLDRCDRVVGAALLALHKHQAVLLGQDRVGPPAHLARHVFHNVRTQHVLNLLLLEPTCTAPQQSPCISAQGTHTGVQVRARARERERERDACLLACLCVRACAHMSMCVCVCVSLSLSLCVCVIEGRRKTRCGRAHMREFILLMIAHASACACAYVPLMISRPLASTDPDVPSSVNKN